MAKRKITPLAQALVLVDCLGPDEQQTLSDYLRGKLPQRPRTVKKPKVVKLPDNPEEFHKGATA